MARLKVNLVVFLFVLVFGCARGAQEQARIDLKDGVGVEHAIGEIVADEATDVVPPGPVERPGIPRRARRYYRLLYGESRLVWGLDAPVSLFAGQIHQESGWRPDAQSPYAGGLAQFTPATADWMQDLFPSSLSGADPYNPSWAVRALVRYDDWLYSRLKSQADGIPDCDRWAMALSGYNGGAGWVSRDRKLTVRAGGNPDRWWGHVANYTARADWARKENRAYPRKILYRWEPLYRSAGWGGDDICSD